MSASGAPGAPSAPGALTVPAGKAAAEIEVKKSRFIAEVFPVAGAAEARRIIGEQKRARPGASHIAHAFAVGERGEVRGMSDAGEPPGTAGKPVMDALTGCGCTDILITVTRFFGGTLLGTGGLARAYAAAARAALERCAFTPARRAARITVRAPWAYCTACRRALERAGAPGIRAEAAADGVRLTCAVPLERGADIAALRDALLTASNGRAAVDET